MSNHHNNKKEENTNKVQVIQPQNPEHQNERNQQTEKHNEGTNQ